QWAVLVMQLVHGMRLARYMRGQGVVLVEDPKFRFLDALLQDVIPPSQFVNYLADPARDAALWRWPLQVGRAWLKGSPIQRRPAALVSPEKHVIATSVGSNIEAHARHSEGAVVFRPASGWFEPLSRVEISKDAHSLVARLMDVLASIFRSAEVQPSKTALSWLRHELEQSSDAVMCQLASVRSRRDLPVVLWNGTSSDPWARVLAYAAREQGAQVIAHDHGAGVGLYAEQHHALFAQPVCTKFMVVDPGQNASVSQLFQLHAWFDTPIPTILSLSASSAAREEISPQTKQPMDAGSSTGRSVLFVPLPNTGAEPHAVPYPDDVQALHLTARIVQDLIGAGHAVTLKPHPSYPWPRKEEWEDLGAAVSSDRFEDIASGFDVLLFGYPTTSTLHWALGSGQPLVVMALGVEQWAPAYFGKLSEHARVLTLKWHASGPLAYDRHALLEAVQRA
ncbi:MAG: hypothetical protein AAGG72_07685, partial [Pseudomonadota bacterium]